MNDSSADITPPIKKERQSVAIKNKMTAGGVVNLPDYAFIVEASPTRKRQSFSQFSLNNKMPSFGKQRSMGKDNPYYGLLEVKGLSNSNRNSINYSKFSSDDSKKDNGIIRISRLEEKESHIPNGIVPIPK